MNADQRPINEAPKDGTVVRLFKDGETAVTSYWSAERIANAEGGHPRDYRAGWYTVGDDNIEFEAPTHWAPLGPEDGDSARDMVG